MSDNNGRWDTRFLNLAKHVASWSKDPSTQCGAVIVRKDRTIAALGYNGFPRGISDDPALYADRPTKYARVVHAEMNAILTCPERPAGLTLYVYSNGWGPTCDRCAVHVIQSGITQVKYDIAPVPDRARASVAAALDLFREAGVLVEGVRL